MVLVVPAWDLYDLLIIPRGVLTLNFDTIVEEPVERFWTTLRSRKNFVSRQLLDFEDDDDDVGGILFSLFG